MSRLAISFCLARPWGGPIVQETLQDRICIFLLISLDFRNAIKMVEYIIQEILKRDPWKQ